jgi:hypothetical protein
MRTLSCSAAIACAVTLWACAPASSQEFRDHGAYCRAMGEVSLPILAERAAGTPRSRIEAEVKELPQKEGLKFISELIEFAFSRPAGATVEAMRAELIELCLAKKIFVPD